MPNEPTAGIEREEFLALFLDTGDFLPSMRCMQDTREQGPDPNDRSFPKCHGIFSGFTVWMDTSGQPLWRVVDIRWNFPSAKQASAYHEARLLANSEGRPAIATAPRVGQECKVFGGTESLVTGTRLTHFFYIFRVSNVLVKLFAAGEPDAQRELTLTEPAKVARAIETRITAALRY